MTEHDAREHRTVHVPTHTKIVLPSDTVEVRFPDSVRPTVGFGDDRRMWVHHQSGCVIQVVAVQAEAPGEFMFMNTSVVMPVTHDPETWLSVERL